MKKLRLGVLGCSNHFIKRVVLPVKELENVDLCAIASRNIKKAEEIARQFQLQKSYGNYQHLLDDKNIDAVYIPLPNHMHFEWVKKAAVAGKHILCEKPMCMNADEGQELVEVCQKNNVVLMEAFMYKYHPQWIKVKNIIRTNNIGKIQYINTAFSYNNPSASNIRNIKEFGGGALRDIGCYAISVPRFLLDKEPQRVISLMSQHPDFGTDMLTSAMLDFGTVRATFNTSTCATAFQRVDIVGSAGMIIVQLPFNAYTDVPAKITVETAIGTREVEIESVDQYGLMVDNFACKIIEKATPSDDEDDAICNQKVLDAILLSSKSEKWETIS
jgi:predicted dehydrogenase